MRSLAILGLTLLVLAGLAVPALASTSSSGDHRGHVRVCHDGWVEHAPADHPIAPAYAGDSFVIERRAYASVHHSNGRTEHFAKGRLVHRDRSTVKPVVHRGWISTDALRCS